jgi:hypothetical protein
MQPCRHAFRLPAPLRPWARGGQAEEVLLFELVKAQGRQQQLVTK